MTLAVLFYLLFWLANQYIWQLSVENPSEADSYATANLIVTILWIIVPLAMIILTFRGILAAARQKAEQIRAGQDGWAPNISTPNISTAASVIEAPLPFSSEPSDNIRSETEDDRLDEEAAWGLAYSYMQNLIDGSEPTALTVPAAFSVEPFALRPDEEIWAFYPGEFHLPTHVARYFGDELGDEDPESLREGYPLYVRAGLDVTSDQHVSYLTDEEISARAEWSALTEASVIVTDQRIAYTLDKREWVSLEHENITILFPTPERWTLVLEYDDRAPLLLTGLEIPALCALVVFITQDRDELRREPALESLQSPELPD